MVELGFDVVSLPDSDHCEVGETAPEFERPLVTAEYWEDQSLSGLTDQTPVLLVFYPMDGAFPAKYMWDEITDRAWEHDRELQIVGLSISTPYEHGRFIEQQELPYPLFSDPKNTVAVEYGVVNDLDGMTGIDEPRPATVLLDTDREIRDVWVATEWPEFPPYDELEATIADVCPGTD